MMADPRRKEDGVDPKAVKTRIRRMPPCRHISVLSGVCSKNVRLLIGTTIPIKYAVLDGAFGNNSAVQMILRCDMHIISKLKRTSALYFLFTGPYGGRGAKRKYGDKLDYNNIPRKYLRETTTKRRIWAEIYQMTML